MQTTTLPVNFRKHDRSRTAIDTAVSYAIGIADGYLGHWRMHATARPATANRPLAGLRVLEIGPGATLGAPVLLACAGADVGIADRFPAQWDPEFHPAFFEALLERVRERGSRFGEPIRRLLRAGGFDPGVVASYELSAEETHRIGIAFDLVLTNAVLEHVNDLQVTVANLARLTARGGYGFHQVDLRDHRDFARPLEFLTMASHDFDALRAACFCECGGRWRASEISAIFEEAGLAVERQPNLWAEREYLVDVRPRLQPEFAALPHADLATLSALFVTHRAS